MAKKNNLNIIDLVSSNGCFNLQFRKDARHERPNSPTYYRWKVQFVITNHKEKVKLIKKVGNILGCGKVHITKDQARFSVQKIDDIIDFVVPFFNKNTLLGKKKKDFEMWQRAVDIIHRNKGKYIANWKRNELLSLIEIHKSTLRYKGKTRQPKWIEMAKSMAKSL